MMSWVCNSQFEALAIPRNCKYSPLVALPWPSAMLLAMETEARLN
jgi:hypothetical protein